jgi:hypothetical protein
MAVVSAFTTQNHTVTSGTFMNPRLTQLQDEVAVTAGQGYRLRRGLRTREHGELAFDRFAGPLQHYF